MAIRQFKSDLSLMIGHLKESNVEALEHQAIKKISEDIFDYLFLVGLKEDLQVDCKNAKFLDQMFQLETHDIGLIN